MASSELDLGEEVAEPYRFNFEIAWEVANKGQIRQRQASVWQQTLRQSVSLQRGATPELLTNLDLFVWQVCLCYTAVYMYCFQLFMPWYLYKQVISWVALIVLV